jgi:nicotinate phosphoribosyltransferase
LSFFRFTEGDVAYLRTILPPSTEEAFFDYLRTMSLKDLKVYAILDGSVVFPKEPLIRVEGPIAIAQLIETTLLNLVNYPSLITTNACRMKLAAGEEKQLIEFGLRRAQGPDGAISGSKYAYVGGFEGTSNVLAGKLFHLPVSGTHAHSFVMSYSSLEELPPSELKEKTLEKRKKFDFFSTNEGELAAFISFAFAFPNKFLALIDTYDIISSGIKNFLCVAWALLDLGYKPIGVRIDSGDLSYFSKAVRDELKKAETITNMKDTFSKMKILASSDINEDVLISLSREGHEVDIFGIGTHLITCQKQPALGKERKLLSHMTVSLVFASFSLFFLS